MVDRIIAWDRAIHEQDWERRRSFLSSRYELRREIAARGYLTVSEKPRTYEGKLEPAEELLAVILNGLSLYVRNFNDGTADGDDGGPAEGDSKTLCHFCGSGSALRGNG